MFEIKHLLAKLIAVPKQRQQSSRLNQTGENKTCDSPSRISSDCVFALAFTYISRINSELVLAALNNCIYTRFETAGQNAQCRCLQNITASLSTSYSIDVIKVEIFRLTLYAMCFRKRYRFFHTHTSHHIDIFNLVRVFSGGCKNCAFRAVKTTSKFLEIGSIELCSFHHNHLRNFIEKNFVSHTIDNILFKCVLISDFHVH